MFSNTATGEVALPITGSVAAGANLEAIDDNGVAVSRSASIHLRLETLASAGKNNYSVFVFATRSAIHSQRRRAIVACLLSAHHQHRQDGRCLRLLLLLLAATS